MHLDSLLSKVGRSKSAVGGDLIASLSIGLYQHPLEVYRELIQNAADAYQSAGTRVGRRRVDIEINRTERSVRVRDYATGLAMDEVAERLFCIGQSDKRGKNLRGFRGIGRLAALGYCKRLTFRSRKASGDKVWELRWDSIALYRNMARPNGRDVVEVLRDISTADEVEPSEDTPRCFFECVMEGVRPVKNEVLLNSGVVSAYLSEISPVGFREDFSFKGEAYRIMGKTLPFEVDIFINGDDRPLMRPHVDEVISADGKSVVTAMHSIHSIKEFDDGFGATARGWILHHDYPGALPKCAGVRGLRVRVGNMQVGDEHILGHLFRETRFNVWCIGEIHICSPEIRPNTRRDGLELSPVLDDLENSMRVLARKMTAACRESSFMRTRKAKTTRKDLIVSAKKYRDILTQLNVEKPFPDKITLTSKRRSRS